MQFDQNEKILLFYKDWEADKFVRYDRYLKQIVRPFYNLWHHKQKVTGYFMATVHLRRVQPATGTGRWCWSVLARARVSAMYDQGSTRRRRQVSTTDRVAA